MVKFKITQMYDPVLGSDKVCEGLRGQGIEIDRTACTSAEVRGSSPEFCERVDSISGKGDIWFMSHVQHCVLHL